jgi:hypothetical protein
MLYRRQRAPSAAAHGSFGVSAKGRVHVTRPPGRRQQHCKPVTTATAAQTATAMGVSLWSVCFCALMAAMVQHPCRTGASQNDSHLVHVCVCGVGWGGVGWGVHLFGCAACGACLPPTVCGQHVDAQPVCVLHCSSESDFMLPGLELGEGSQPHHTTPAILYDVHNGHVGSFAALGCICNAAGPAMRLLSVLLR